jgi:hypothetical protein
MIDGELGLDWQSSVETSSFTAVNGNGYFVNTTSGSITVTMLSSPTTGDSIGIIDYAGTAASNTITLTSSNNIQGSSNDKIVNYTRGALRITYADVTQGWVASAAANEGTSALNSILLVDFLVVAGGGAGGSAYAGGGAGGGLRTSYGPSGGTGGAETAFAAYTGTNYTVEVGPGGAPSSGIGGSGMDSKFGVVGSEIISKGGGGGAGAVANQSGALGGSGGGGSFNGSQSPGAGTTNQGYGGGSAAGTGGADAVGGGGGGAGASGGNASNGVQGNGGGGRAVTIIGTSTYAGGGGGSGGNNTSGGAGGAGGGGAGASTYASGINGTDFLGGGGGGNQGIYTNGKGGSGVIILRYPNTFTAAFSAGVTQVETTATGVKINTITAAGAGDTITFS